jgi:hypothetical protein
MISMTAKAKVSSGSTILSPMREPRDGIWLTPPWTLDERVKRIELLGQRMEGYIKFMCQVPSLTGTSAEAKELGVTAFYERLVVAEGQLRLIHDKLRLE